jgi:hypothetical protein
MQDPGLDGLGFRVESRTQDRGLDGLGFKV